MKSHKPKGNIKSQRLICLLSTAPVPFMWSVYGASGTCWGLFFEVRVSQTILITPVGFTSATLVWTEEITKNVVLNNFWRGQTATFVVVTAVGSSEMVPCIRPRLIILTSVFLIVRRHAMTKVQPFIGTHALSNNSKSLSKKAAMKCMPSLDKSNRWHWFRKQYIKCNTHGVRERTDCPGFCSPLSCSPPSLCPLAVPEGDEQHLKKIRAQICKLMQSRGSSYLWGLGRMTHAGLYIGHSRASVPS